MEPDCRVKNTQNKQNTGLPGKTGLACLALINRSGTESDFNVKNTQHKQNTELPTKHDSPAWLSSPGQVWSQISE